MGTGEAVARDESLQVTGVVIELLPRALYRVELQGTRHVLAHVADTTQRNFVRLLAGDRVSVQLSQKDRTRGRITRKL